MCRSRKATATSQDYLYVEDARGILACVQMGTIEFHGWGSRVDKLEYPDRLVFDLDPDVGPRFRQGEGGGAAAPRTARRPRPRNLPAADRRQGHPCRRAARRYGRLAQGQELRRTVQPGDRRGRAGNVHRQHPQGPAQGPHLPRLAAQPARRDRGHALFGARPRRRAGRRADRLGGAGQGQERRRPIRSAMPTS